MLHDLRWPLGTLDYGTGGSIFWILRIQIKNKVGLLSPPSPPPPLPKKDWTEIDDSSNIEDMVQLFTENVTEALDELALFKTITIRSNYKFGLSEYTIYIHTYIPPLGRKNHLLFKIFTLGIQMVLASLPAGAGRHVLVKLLA